MSQPPSDLAALQFKVLNWIGIVAQLSGTLANQRLAPLGLTLTQFVFLNHMSFRGQDGLTVTEIARALQTPQPGVTKTSRKLLERGLLNAVPNPQDGRSKILHLTDDGRRLRDEAVAELATMAAPAFQEIPSERLAVLIDDLDRLKLWFDDHRQET